MKCVYFYFIFDNWSLDILINLSVNRVLFHQWHAGMNGRFSILNINGGLFHKSLGQACKHDWENFKFLCDFSNYLILTRTYWSLTPLSLIPPKHYENASSLLVFIRFSDFISGKPFYIVAYMLSEIPTSRFWGRGRVLVVHEATPCFLFFFTRSSISRLAVTDFLQLFWENLAWFGYQLTDRQIATSI